MLPTANPIKGSSFKTDSFYKNPTQRIIQNGCFSQLAELLKSFHPHKILLVLGEKSFRSSRYFNRLMEMLAPYQFHQSAPVTQNPTQSFIEDELNRLKAGTAPSPYPLPLGEGKGEGRIDLVLAIGGGSVLDVSKIFAAFLKNSVRVNAFLKGNKELQEEPVPLIAIPTTSGTGSEVTQYVSLETSEQKKVTLDHDYFYPRFALIDPELTYSMSSYVSASTGFDALSQAVESFWSIHATPFSRTHALRALDAIVGSLDQVIHNPQDSNSRFNMSLASCEAGLAIAQTKTTAVHSVSYPITAHFRIAHGHACALTLSSFIRFNAPVLKEEGRPMLRAFKSSSYEDMADQVDHLMEKVGLQRKLSSLSIKREGLELILRDGFRPDRIKNNPREVTKDALRDILNQIF